MVTVDDVTLAHGCIIPILTNQTIEGEAGDAQAPDPDYGQCNEGMESLEIHSLSSSQVESYGGQGVEVSKGNGIYEECSILAHIMRKGEISIVVHRPEMTSILGFSQISSFYQ